MTLRKLFTVAVLCRCAVHAAPESGQAGFQEALKQPWRTLTLDFFHRGGDQTIMGPCLHIHRLPDKRIVVSYAEAHNASAKDLVPWGFMTEAEVAEVVAGTVRIREKARAELSASERAAAQKPSLEEQIAKLPADKQAELKPLLVGSESESLMKVRVATTDRREDDQVFESAIGESAGEWMKFLKKAARSKR